MSILFIPFIGFLLWLQYFELPQILASIKYLLVGYLLLNVLYYGLLIRKSIPKLAVMVFAGVPLFTIGVVYFSGTSLLQFFGLSDTSPIA